MAKKAAKKPAAASKPPQAAPQPAQASVDEDITDDGRDVVDKDPQGKNEVSGGVSGGATGDDEQGQAGGVSSSAVQLDEDAADGEDEEAEGDEEADEDEELEEDDGEVNMPVVVDSGMGFVPSELSSRSALSIPTAGESLTTFTSLSRSYLITVFTLECTRYA